MQIRPIRSGADHEAALREIEILWGAAEDTEAGDRLDVLVTLVDAYETKRWPIALLDPVQPMETAMAMNGYTRADLAALVGQSRATEILVRKRAPTLGRIVEQIPSSFWRLIVALLAAMGYGGSQEDAARQLGRSGEGGVEGVIDEDRLGLDRIYVQAN